MADETAQLREALARATRERDAAVRDRDTVATRLRSEAGGRLAAETTAIDNAITAAENELGNYERQIADFNAEGKFAEAAQLTRKMAETSARVAGYRIQKDAVAADQAKIAEAPQPRQEPQVTYSTREQAWIGAHPEYNTDPVYREKANAAANYAVRVLGVERDSDAYFQHISEAISGKPASPAAAEPQPQPGHADPGVTIPDANTAPLPSFTPMPNGGQPQAGGGSAGDPAMSIETQMVEQMFPQQRAVGNGGPGIASVAAPPTRRIVELSNMHAAGRLIEPTLEELETARVMIGQLAPEIAQQGDEAIVRAYHAWYHSPSAQRKLKRWYGNAAP